MLFASWASPSQGSPLSLPHSGRQFILWNRELVRLTSADQELALAAATDLAGDGIVEEAMPQPIDNDLFEMRERFGDLTAMGAKRCGVSLSVTHCAAVPSCL